MRTLLLGDRCDTTTCVTTFFFRLERLELCATSNNVEKRSVDPIPSLNVSFAKRAFPSVDTDFISSPLYIYYTMIFLQYAEPFQRVQDP